MKIKRYIVVILLICTIAAGGAYAHHKTIDRAYEYAISLIRNGSYEGALDELEKANPDILDRNKFRTDVQYGKIKDCYKNSVPLYSYALAQLEYNAENRHMLIVNMYLELIPEDYNDELCEEIKSFKDNFEVQYDEYLKEQERKAEEARVESQKREKEYVTGLKSKIPYKGMSEVYIDSTAAGKSDKKNSEFVKGTKNSGGYTRSNYFWYADNNTDVVLIVECKDGVVSDVIKYFENVYWTSDGRPNFGAVRPRTSAKNKRPSKNDDPYNVDDYSDPEDFYYDNYDDFWDYEEAEDYYNSYHD